MAESETRQPLQDLSAPNTLSELRPGAFERVGMYPADLVLASSGRRYVVEVKTAEMPPLNTLIRHVSRVQSARVRPRRILRPVSQVERMVWSFLVLAGIIFGVLTGLAFSIDGFVIDPLMGTLACLGIAGLMVTVLAWAYEPSFQ